MSQQEDLTVGTKIVLTETLDGQVSGSVGMVILVGDSFVVRFPGGQESELGETGWKLLSDVRCEQPQVVEDFRNRIIFRCVIGSRAYGLDDERSDTDRRGIYLPRAERHWSLRALPEQIDDDANQETYWEIGKFINLALKANPNILECLHSPIVELATPLAEEIIAARDIFLSRLVYQTYNGYVLSQFRKLQVDRSRYGVAKPKHLMHLIRLLLSGITVLREHRVTVDVGEHRAQLLAIRRNEMPWEEIDAWRLRLHHEFDAAFATTTLSEKPDFEAADRLLIHARRAALAEELP